MYNMKNKYNCISVLSVTKAMFIALFVVLPNLLIAQQAPSIRTGATFQWADTQATSTSSATIESVTINGQVYNNFVVPSGYELTRLGPDGHSPNTIEENGTTLASSSAIANWNTIALSAFQDKNLNHFFGAASNGRNICLDFAAVETTDAQKQSIFYSPAIPANEGGILAVTERHNNNCFHVAIFGTPVGGGPDQLLGQTFVRQNSTITGPKLPPNQVPDATTDYWKTDRVVSGGGNIGMALFYLSDIVPIGSKISRIEFNASTADHGDGKFLLLQKYAIDQLETGCIDNGYSGDVDTNNNVPENSTYSLISGPTPAGLSFTFNTDGTYTYEPTPGFTGDVTFEYQVCLPAPNTSVCDQATVTLSYVALPDEPDYSIACGSSDDDFTLTVNSPLGSEYEYSINNGTSFQTSPIFNSLLEGSYNLIVKNTSTLCQKNSSANPIILQNLELTGTVVDVLCYGGGNGSIDITVTGGAPSYTFDWSNRAEVEDLNSIGAGTYTVTVTDANGCTISQDFTVNEPATAVSQSLTAQTNLVCSGVNEGSITIAGSGGVSPYTYSIDNGSNYQVSGTFSSLPAGSYSITVKDANGCTNSCKL